MKHIAKFCVLAAVIAVGVPANARAEGFVSVGWRAVRQ
jgi:hypothetical protein